MPKRARFHVILLLALIAGCCLSFLQAASDPIQVFEKPPESARPWTFWYWMNGAVSKEGITADLEVMKRVGLGGAYLVPIKDVATPPLFQPSVRTLTPEWWAMVRHAFAEADRLGLKLGMHSSDGFATAGGPWITPELSMQKVVWTEQQIDGGRLFDGKISQPAVNEGYYRDIAVLAFPAQEGAGISTQTIVPKVTTNVPGADSQALAVPGNTKRLRSEEACWIQYEFPKPFDCRSIVVRPDGANYAALRLILEVSDDGKSFRSLGRLETPRHGWQDWDAPYTFSIPSTTARFFRFMHNSADAEAPAEDLDSAKWRNVLKVLGIELSAVPRIPNYEGKSGLVWRRSSRADAKLLPDSLCIPRGKAIDITAALAADGHLKWQAPAGRWTILRVGYTTTGHRNETAGAGKGLECDKFNPAAARLQFDKWFGETVRQVGPELATKVLKIFHVDSWEAGCQNWSPVFQEQFKQRRGYDLTPYLPLFAGFPVESAEKSEQVLCDIRQTITELTQDGFFKPLAELAKKHGCTITAEATAPTMMGDGMLHHSVVDVPMGEFWLHSPTSDKPNDVHDAISAAHVYGKPTVMMEAFTQRNLEWNEYPGMLKALGDHNLTLGVNKFLLHVFVHNPWLDRKPGMTLSNIGLFFQRDQTWFEPARAWIDYLTRCQALLQLGKPVIDVAYFAGDELPSRAILPERYQPSLPVGYKADSINRDALIRLATVRDGRIELPGGASYAVLVVNASTQFSPEVARKLDELRKGGATIYECGHEQKSLATSLAEHNVAPDVILEGEAQNHMEWTHRVADTYEVYFLSNPSIKSCAAKFSLRGRYRDFVIIDPVARELVHTKPVVAGERTVWAINLPANGSAFVVCGSNAAPAAGSEVLPKLQIDGTWSVSFDAQTSGEAAPVEFKQLTSWADHEKPGIRFYSGTATYQKSFEWPAPAVSTRVWLDLGEVANIAEIKVNGVACGVAWTPPYRVEITKAIKPGKNSLEVRVSNTWLNRLIGDRALPTEKRVTWTTANLVSDKAMLQPAGLLGPVQLFAEKPSPDAVTDAEMQSVYDEVKTPFKYGVVLQPEKDELFDCPNVFRHEGKWYMMYVANKNQVGYETYLASSDDLLHWTKLGKLLSFRQEGWDAWQADGGLALVDYRWNGTHGVEQYDGRYWLSYIGGAKQGYEPDPLAIGLAWTNHLTNAKEWTRLPENPVLSTTQSGVRQFESVTLYKSTIIHDKTQTLGSPFVMFYNGKQKAGNHEAIGMALSRDMVHWTRLGDEPVVDNAPGKAAISGDPQIVKIGDLWVMFYFGFRWKPGAFDTFAVSRDLVHWTKWEGPHLVEPTVPWDKPFAHKPWLLKHAGVVYHFYCGYSKEFGRVIALATSKDLHPDREVPPVAAHP